MQEKIFQEFSKLEEVEAIALGGSRAGNNYDEKSDYDVYIYTDAPISEDKRKNILAASCKYMELGNSFWELEDDCILKNGIEIEILYRNMENFIADIQKVVEEYQPYNAYTTCMWHNLITCKIIYDKSGKLETYQKKYTMPYPEPLRKNIIERQLKLLDTSMPAYKLQIEKALYRRDIISVNHRVTEFLASYFDLIYAINRKTHPGEKRLVELTKKYCSILPKDFEENLKILFSHLYVEDNGQMQCMDDIIRIVENVKKLLEEEKHS